MKQFGAVKLGAADSTAAQRPKPSVAAAGADLEPMFGSQRIDPTLEDGQIVTLLVRRFGASEVADLMQGTAFQVWMERGAGKDRTRFPSPVKALLGYVHQRMWFEYRLPTTRLVVPAPLPNRDEFALIGLSPQGWAVVYCHATGRLHYADCNRAELNPRMFEWAAFAHYQAPTGRGPSCAQVDGSTVCLWFDQLNELHIVELNYDVANAALGAGEDAIARHTIIRPTLMDGAEVQCVTANPFYCVVVDTRGLVAFYNVNAPNVSPLVQFMPLLEPQFVMAPEGTADAGATVQDPHVEPAVHRVIRAQFNELNMTMVMLSSVEGNEFTVQLPELRLSEPVAPDTQRHLIVPTVPIDPSELTITMHDLSCENKRGPNAAPLEAPSHAPATTVSFRQSADDFVIVKGTHTALQWQASRSEGLDKALVPDRMSRFEHNDTSSWNCVAVCGTALIAHAASGQLFCYSMLRRRHSKLTMELTTDKENTVPCSEVGHRSLYVTPNRLYCLLGDGRVLICF
jgi:hypothetical protein